MTILLLKLVCYSLNDFVTQSLTPFVPPSDASIVKMIKSCLFNIKGSVAIAKWSERQSGQSVRLAIRRVRVQILAQEIFSCRFFYDARMTHSVAIECVVQALKQQK